MDRAPLLRNKILRPLTISALFAAAVVLALAAGETSLRVAGVERKGAAWARAIEDRSWCVPDPRRIWALRADCTMDFQGWRHKTDADGFRIPDGPRRAASPFTIFVVGDSFTYGHGVNGNETLPFYLQESLMRSGYEASVVNAGVLGYGPGQEYRYLMDVIIPKFRPSMILWNLDETDEEDMKRRSLHFLVGNGTMRIPAWSNGIYLEYLLQKLTPPLLEKSLIYDLLLGVMENFDIVWLLERPSTEKSVRKITAMVRDVERSGIPVLVTQTPRRWAVWTPRLSTKPLFNTALSGGLANYFIAAPAVHDWIIRQYLGRNISDIKRAIDALYLPEHIDVNRHLSAAGNRIYAEILFDRLKAAGMLDRIQRQERRP